MFTGGPETRCIKTTSRSSRMKLVMCVAESQSRAERNQFVGLQVSV